MPQSPKTIIKSCCLLWPHIYPPASSNRGWDVTAKPYWTPTHTACDVCGWAKCCLEPDILVTTCPEFYSSRTRLLFTSLQCQIVFTQIKASDPLYLTFTFNKKTSRIPIAYFWQPLTWSLLKPFVHHLALQRWLCFVRRYKLCSQHRKHLTVFTAWGSVLLHYNFLHLSSKLPKLFDWRKWYKQTLGGWKQPRRYELNEEPPRQAQCLTNN